jgi:hypothetical protein
MQRIPKEELDKLIKKYTSRLEKNISRDVERPKQNSEFSREYDTFKGEVMSKAASRYEKMAQFAGKIISTKPNDKLIPKLKESLEVTHLNLTLKDISSFAIFYPILFGLFFLIIAIVSFVFDIVGLSFLMGLLFLISLMLIPMLTKIPISMANKWRIRAGDQIVLCVLYIVIYMRHTSNLENAIKFASDHIGGPIALDLRKVFWDTEVGKYSTIKESLDNYLVLWRDNNTPFVNSIHLIESSLYEPSEERRLSLLDKSLEVILDGVYNGMLKYVHELKNPITMLHMLGVILPILGLVIFPLLSAFMGGYIKWYHLAILYNILLPLLVYSLGTNILSKRPSGYSETLLGYETKKGSLFLPVLIFLIFLIIGISPFLIYYLNIIPDFEFMSMPFLGFESLGGQVYGPFGLGALLLSFALPFGLALSMGVYYSNKTKKLLKLRTMTKRLEKEFSSSLFQLGTRIGDGIPTESAFKDVAATMVNTPTGGLFTKINNNLRRLGMSLRDSIFDSERGALKDYPSPLVESSMEVLVESSKKGPNVVSQSLISISNYVNSVHAVGERLKDLLADILSSMKSQISFMAPVISGIVIGIGSMMVGVISKLDDLMKGAAEGTTDATLNLGALELFDKFSTIPSYFFQVVVGIYVVQVVYILTVLSNGVEHGADKLNEQHSLGKNLIRSIILYSIVALIVVLLFNQLAFFVLDKSLT